MSNIPASGWYAEVTANGYTHRAPIVGGDRSVSPNRKANARPTIRIPVRKADKWDAILGDGSTDIDLDVFHDGARVPIDTLDDVEQEPGATVLVGSGGRELETRIEEFIEQEAVHAAAERLIDNNTAYVSNVDTPTTTTTTNSTLVSLTSNSDFLTRIKNPGDTDVYTVESGTLKQLQTAFPIEGENADRNTSFTGTSSDVDYSGGSAQNFSSDSSNTQDFGEWDFTLDYTLPAENFGLQVRDDDADDADGAPAFKWTLIHNRGTADETSYEIVDQTTVGLDIVLNWTDLLGSSYGGGSYDGPDLTPGDYTLRVEVTDSNGSADQFTYAVDVVAPFDTRFNHDAAGTGNSFDNDNGGSSGFLDDPTKFPPETQVPFDIIPAAEAVAGARAEATLSSGDSDYTHYLSNDQGANFTSGDNSSGSFGTDSLGANFGPGVTYKAGLSRTGSGGSSTPKTGFNTTELQSLTLKADLEDMPIVVNTAFDGQLGEVLARLANIGDQLWAYEREANTESIEWTTPGQRTSTKDPNIETYNSTKTVGQVFQKAVVYGRPDVSVVGERFESDHGNAVSLSKDHLQGGSEVVTDPTSGERFRRNEDYTMDYQAGEITVLAAGDMANSTTFEIDYNFQPVGEFDDGTANPDVVDVDIPGLTTVYGCNQAAELIVNEVSSPLHTARVVIPNDDAAWSVVESLDPDIVPTGGNALHQQAVDNTPERTVLTLGSRRGLDDVVGDIRRQTGALSRQA